MSPNQKKIVEHWLPEAEVWEKWGDISQSVQTLSYKIKKFWRPNVKVTRRPDLAGQS